VGKRGGGVVAGSTGRMGSALIKNSPVIYHNTKLLRFWFSGLGCGRSRCRRRFGFGGCGRSGWRGCFSGWALASLSFLSRRAGSTTRNLMKTTRDIMEQIQQKEEVKILCRNLPSELVNAGFGLRLTTRATFPGSMPFLARGILTGAFFYICWIVLEKHASPS